jgi:hypothetical protein
MLRQETVHRQPPFHSLLYLALKYTFSMSVSILALGAVAALPKAVVLGAFAAVGSVPILALGAVATVGSAAVWAGYPCYRTVTANDAAPPPL